MKYLLRNAAACLMSLNALLSFAAPKTPSPFDPKGYLEKKQPVEPEKATKISKVSIYSLVGDRYLRFESTEGSVYLPASGIVPDTDESRMICPQALKRTAQPLLVRDNVKMGREIAPIQGTILALIRTCQKDLARGPAGVATLDSDVNPN